MQGARLTFLALLVCALLAGPAVAAGPIRFYSVDGGRPAIPFTGDRDQILWAIRADGSFLVNRWEVVGRRELRWFAASGRPLGRAVPWQGVERRMWSPFDAVSPDGSRSDPWSGTPDGAAVVAGG